MSSNNDNNKTEAENVVINWWNDLAGKSNLDFHDVKIELTDSGTGGYVKLDGVKVKGLRDISLKANLSEAPQITITFIPRNLQINKVSNNAN